MSLPAELEALPALTTLRLDGDQLTSPPVELGALTALTLLYLDGDQLTELPAEWEAGAALHRSVCTIRRNGKQYNGVKLFTRIAAG